MKKIIMSMLSLSLIGGACLTGCNKPTDPGNTPPKSEASGYVHIDFTPSMDLILDQYGNVMNVNAANDEARMLLYNETGIVGKSAQEAIKKITELAKELGYLDNNDVVEVLTHGISNDKATQIKSSIISAAQDIGLMITTNSQGDFALTREFEEFKSKYPQTQAVQDLTISKFKLLKSIADTGNFSLESVMELNQNDLIAKLNDNVSKIELYMTEGFQEAKNIAKTTFDQAKLFLNDTVYAIWFNQQTEINPEDSYLGAMYALYHSTGESLKKLTETIQDNFNIKKFPLNQTQIDEILNILNINDSSVLKDDNQMITIDSIENYFDELTRTNVSSDWETVKVSLDTALDTIEIEITSNIEVIKDKYLEYLETMFTKAELSLNLLESLSEVLNSNDDTKDVAAEIDNHIDIYNGALTKIKSFIDDPMAVLNTEDLTTIYQTLLATSDTLKEQIESKLTETQLAQIETMKKTISLQLTDLEIVFEQALEEAEEIAKEALITLKENREEQ